MATRVRDWAHVDYYRRLGIAPGATDDEIAQAFRAAAKRMHPDTTADPVVAEEFKDVAAAYAVLSDPVQRREYDRVRASVVVVPPPSTTVRPARPAGPPPRVYRRAEWTPRRARIAFVGGILLTVLGVVAGLWTWQLHEHDASRRAHFVPIVAQRVSNGDIVFTTAGGERYRTREPVQRGEGSGIGPTVNVRYDPANPEHVIVDADTFGRDITLAIVSLKLIIGGAVIAWYGRRRLNRLRA